MILGTSVLPYSPTNAVKRSVGKLSSIVAGLSC
jgi:hypothetical protein